MMDVEFIRLESNEFLEKKGISQTALAKEIGVKQSSLWRFLSGATGLSLGSGLKLLEKMGYKIIAPGEPEPLPEKEKALLESQISLLRELLDEKTDALADAKVTIQALKNDLLTAQADLSETLRRMVDMQEGFGRRADKALPASPARKQIGILPDTPLQEAPADYDGKEEKEKGKK